MKKLILISLSLMQSLIIAQIVYETEQSFNFYDEFNNSQSIIIGKNQWASDGLDPELGEIVIPQVPSGQFGVRFQLPIDTSLTTSKDIRFGCYWTISHEHLIDLSYASGSSIITIQWIWEDNEFDALQYVDFIDPFTGELLASYSWSQNPEYFIIPYQLNKIRIYAGYGGTLSLESYQLSNPNGGEIIEAGSNYLINWTVILALPGMNIEFSSDSGASWSYILENYWGSSNFYDWTVPMITSTNCLIRVGKYPCTYDVSDSVFTITFPVSVEDENNLPKEFSLSQNYPNPFNPITNFEYRISNSEFVSLKVYDVLGNEIATLVNEAKTPGFYEIEFDGTDLTSGIYFYRLTSGSFVQTRKMVILK